VNPYKKKLKGPLIKEFDFQRLLFAKYDDQILAQTTLMIKNIPIKFTQRDILGLIDKYFPETYDYFYLPMDFRTN
jgi:hypothetical protein